MLSVRSSRARLIWMPFRMRNLVPGLVLRANPTRLVSTTSSLRGFGQAKLLTGALQDAEVCALMATASRTGGHKPWRFGADELNHELAR